MHDMRADVTQDVCPKPISNLFRLTSGRLAARHPSRSLRAIVFPSAGFHGVSYQHVSVVGLTASVLSFSVATESHGHEEALDTFISVFVLLFLCGFSSFCVRN